MSKKTRNIIIILLIYIISLFLFEVIIGDGNYLRIAEECDQKGFNTPFPYFTSYIIAGINHFVIVTVIAVICIFIKPIDKTYKKVLCIFPVMTFIFTLPTMLLAMIFAKTFHIYGF